MQIEDSHSVCQFLAEETNEKLTVKVNWHEKYFDIAIFDGVNAYSGTMTEEEIVKFSSQLGIEIEDYLNKCKAALTSNIDKNFVYKTDGNLFQWKKVSSDMKITFGSVLLTGVPVVETLSDIIDVTVSNSCQLKENFSHLNEEKNLLENDNKELLQRIEEYMHMKSDTEIELYNKFLVILNTKKRKILQLEELLKSNKIDDKYVFRRKIRHPQCPNSHSVNWDIEDDGSSVEIRICLVQEEYLPIVSNVPIKEEKDAESTITDLYECDTEVETDNDNTDDEKIEVETTSKTKSNLYKTRKKSFESDLDETPKIYNVPKRFNKKPIKDDSTKVDQTVGDLKVTCKRSSSRIESKYKNYEDEGAGPSGIKLSKVEKYKSKESTCTGNNPSELQKGDSNILVNNEQNKSSNYHMKHDDFQTMDTQLISNTLTNGCINTIPNNEITRNVKVESDVHDILAGLIA